MGGPGASSVRRRCGWRRVVAVVLAGLPAVPACGSDEPSGGAVTVYILQSPDQNPLATARQLTITFQKDPSSTYSETIAAGAVDVPHFTYRFPGESTLATVGVTAAESDGTVRARGASVPILIGPGTNEEVAVLVLRPGAPATGPEQMRLATARALHSSVPVFDQWMLVAGGTSSGVLGTMELFDLRIMKAGPAVPAMPAARTKFAAIPVSPSQTLFLGGVLEATTADVFDASTSTWTSVALPEGVPTTWVAPRFAGLGDGTALVMGGYTTGDTPVSVAALASAGGVQLLSATTTRVDPTLTPVETPDGLRVLVYGGQGLGDVSGLLLDPATGSETEAGVVPDEVRSRHLAIRLGPSRVVIAGGVGEDGSPATYAWVFDASCLAPSSGCDSWSTFGPAFASTPIADAVGVELAAADGDPRVFIGCGVDPTTDAPVADVLVFDTVEAAPPRRSRMVVPRSSCSVLRMQNGQVALIGGVDAGGNPLDTIEFFQPDRL